MASWPTSGSSGKGLANPEAANRALDGIVTVQRFLSAVRSQREKADTDVMRLVSELRQALDATGHPLETPVTG